MELFDGMDCGAEFSPCRQYRYTLWRCWAGDRSTARMMAFVGLNPSKADELTNDNTVKRCMSFAQGFGYDGIWMLNLFAYRATDPKVMQAFHEPVGPGNDEALARVHNLSSLTVVCWGVHGVLHGRDKAVLDLLEPPVYCLGRTKDGHPRHPLYLASDSPCMEFKRG